MLVYRKIIIKKNTFLYNFLQKITTNNLKLFKNKYWDENYSIKMIKWSFGNTFLILPLKAFECFFTIFKKTYILVVYKTPLES